MISGVLWIAIVGASVEDPLIPQPYLRRALSLAWDDSVPADRTNQYADNVDAASLGQLLFFEKGLSGAGETSCATCHDPARGFVDGKQHPRGASGIPRDTPMLWDVARQRWWGWDGRWDSLWMQALAPIESAQEMAGDRLQAIRFIRHQPDLKRRYQNIFGDLPDLSGMPDRTQDGAGPVEQWLKQPPRRRIAINRAFANLGKSIGAYERTLRGPASVFDGYLEALATGDREAARRYPAEARRGLLLFLGKASCISCHNGPLLSDGEFHDTGLLTSGSAAKDAGRYGGVQELQASEFVSSGIYSDQPDGATARRSGRLRRDPTLWGAFRTPSLRQLASTAPYFHDGSLEDLEAVVRFYSRREGGRPAGAGHGHQGETVLNPLGLTDGEERILLRFLQSLSSVGSNKEG
ncbi:MAG: cytochrome c peroxidase [Planctomycetota bacterium]|nr:cytochrome c peroxidase [Planctomycetota bacterium]